MAEAIITTTITITDPALLRLLQLASPLLPVGAYAYSQGLEYAVHQGWVRDEASVRDWIAGLLRHALARVDVPVLARLYRAWMDGDAVGVRGWNDWLYATRETRELRLENRQLGMALARLLADLGLTEAEPWQTDPRACFATPFALAAARWAIRLADAAAAYAWAWCENQTAAAIKLIPLGQTAGQRILSAVQPVIVAAVGRGLGLADDDLGCATPALALASTLHETQYSRLFRS
ncbi:MAG: urease accessory protein UreF [Gammaproteobacteria bacterium]